MSANPGSCNPYAACDTTAIVSKVLVGMGLQSHPRVQVMHGQLCKRPALCWQIQHCYVWQTSKSSGDAWLSVANAHTVLAKS
eukprot:6513437-Karenia_brevis.AAC.1